MFSKINMRGGGAEDGDLENPKSKKGWQKSNTESSTEINKK